MMRFEKYETPEMEIVLLGNNDVITASTEDLTGGDNGDPWDSASNF